jgi:hypothetical protein
LNTFSRTSLGTNTLATLVLDNTLLFLWMANTSGVPIDAKIATFAIAWHKSLLPHPSRPRANTVPIKSYGVVQQCNSKMNLKVMATMFFAEILLPLRWTDACFGTFTDNYVAGMDDSIQTPAQYTDVVTSSSAARSGSPSGLSPAQFTFCQVGGAAPPHTPSPYTI